MPTSKMKTTTKNEYTIKYKVVGSMDELTQDQLKALALRQIRSSARSAALANLNEVEPSIAANIQMRDGLIAVGLDEDKIAKFFELRNANFSVPTQFEIPLSSLVPSEDTTRGKKAADVFSFGETEEADDDDDDAATETEEVEVE